MLSFEFLLSILRLLPLLWSCVRVCVCNGVSKCVCVWVYKKEIENGKAKNYEPNKGHELENFKERSSFDRKDSTCYAHTKYQMCFAGNIANTNTHTVSHSLAHARSPVGRQAVDASCNTPCSQIERDRSMTICMRLCACACECVWVRTSVNEFVLFCLYI